MRMSIKNCLPALVMGLLAVWGQNQASAATIAITEWMYSPQASGSPAEFFELTNVTKSPINLTGWSQDDSNRTVGSHSLSAFGTIQPGESVIGIEGSNVAAFRTYWGLPASVKVIGYGTSNNLGRADEINIYNASGTLIDRLTFDDQTIGGPRTQGTSANIALTNLGLNKANLAAASKVGDIYGSYRGNSGTGDLGNPGVYAPFVVPEPATLGLAGIAVATLLASRVVRRRGK